MFSRTILLVALLAAPLLVAAAPEQIHLAVTTETSEMLVSWVDSAAVYDAEVKYGFASGEYTLHVSGSNHTYAKGGFDATIYEATMTQLEADAYKRRAVYYVVGGNGVWSEEFSFNLRPQPDITHAKYLLVGDEGIEFSHKTMERMQAEVDGSTVDMIIHVGDISYADDYNLPNSHVLDTFMNRVQGYAARMPYMTCPGNHERQFDFAAYRNRFRMPGDRQPGANGNFYYSYDYGNVHWLFWSSETNYSRGSDQYNFIVNDLKAAAANRDRVPWIISVSHRPFYCSNLLANLVTKRCGPNSESTVFRDLYEDLFHGRVDVAINGHNHNYERTHPVFNNTRVGSYNNAKAPVYVVNGAAGDREFNEFTFQEPAPEWRAYATGLWGYARMDVTRSALKWEYVNDLTGNVLDSFELTK